MNTVLAVSNARLTWLSVTNSASSPTKSPAWGISLTIRGMKVAWLFLCFRAKEASVSSTLASMGFLTEEDSHQEQWSDTGYYEAWRFYLKGESRSYFYSSV